MARDWTAEKQTGRFLALLVGGLACFSVSDDVWRAGVPHTLAALAAAICWWKAGMQILDSLVFRWDQRRARRSSGPGR